MSQNTNDTSTLDGLKIAVTGAARDRAAVKTHDIGLFMRHNEAGEIGFEIVVGGGQGRTPVIAKTIRKFLAKADMLSYLDTEFTEFDLYDPINDVLYDYSGNELNKSPGWTATLGYQHEWSLGERGDISAGMLAYYMDDHYLRFQNDSLSQQDSYTKLDLNLTYKSPRGNWFVSAYGKNVTDEDVMVSTTVTSGATGGFAAPRTYGVRAGMNW